MALPPFDRLEAPVIMGHRGAPMEAPENTPASFAAAHAAGATWVELDARRSADGVAVVAHDGELGDGTPVVSQTADALAARGVWRLTDVLGNLPGGLGVNVEIKNLPGDADYDEEQTVAAMVAAALGPHVGSRPLLATSFNPLTVVALQEALPGVPTGILHVDTLAVVQAAELAREFGAGVIASHVDAPGLDHDGVARAHDAGCAVMVWTVNDPQRARELAAAGVDALCTDNPALLVTELRLA